MSYIRLGERNSDVYVFESSSGIECCDCLLQERFTSDGPGMIGHLKKHRAAGHVVPKGVISAVRTRDQLKTEIVAVDYFAGTGWGVAAKRLGIHELGVENMPEAVLTREANGMITAYLDVWDGMTHTLPFHDLFIASPPCQTFSMAGGGAGRKALDEVIAAIHRGDFLSLDKLRALGERHDPRTALVLTPLWHISRYLPRLVALEQVPPVLPVWEAYAERMRAWGYSVWVGILNSEQYGVPQTRRRAVLMARWDGVEAAPPTPTHSRYYSRDKTRLDPGVKPWVSMAEALGWNHREVEFVSNDRQAHSARRPAPEPAPTITAGHDSGNRVWVMERHRGAGMNDRHGERKGRPVDEPALTVTGSASGTTPGGFALTSPNSTSTRVTAAEAAALQSYPDGFVWCGSKTKQFLQIGNAVPPLLAEAILAKLLEN